MHSLWGWGSNTEMKKMTFGDAIKSSFILNINYRHSFKKIIFCFISRLGRGEGPKQGRKEGKAGEGKYLSTLTDPWTSLQILNLKTLHVSVTNAVSVIPFQGSSALDAHSVVGRGQTGTPRWPKLRSEFLIL